MLEDKDTHIEKTGAKEWLWFVTLWALGFTSLVIIGGVIKLVLQP